jgi:hypothetical protein
LWLELRARRVENRRCIKEVSCTAPFHRTFLIAFKLTSAPLPQIAEMANDKEEMGFSLATNYPPYPPHLLLPGLLLLALVMH